MNNLADYPGALKVYLDKEHIRSAAVVPLLGSSGAIGTMNLAAMSQHHFDNASLELLMGLGRQIAAGVERVRLSESQTQALAAALAAQAATDTIGAMGNALCLVNITDGKVIAANPAFEKLTGYEESELVGRYGADIVLEVTAQEDQERAKGAFRTSMGGKAPVSAVITFLSKDGQETPTVFTVTFMKDAEGRPTTLIATFNDITELRRAEEALRQSERELSIRNQIANIFLTIGSRFSTPGLIFSNIRTMVLPPD